MFTHATDVPMHLITTSNHLYNDIKGELICLQLSRYTLHKLGIVTKIEEPKPVDQIDMEDTCNCVCPHIFSGIPTKVLGFFTSVYEMERNVEDKFISVSGLTGNKR